MWLPPCYNSVATASIILYFYLSTLPGGFLGGSVVKEPACYMQVRSLGQEDPLEKGMTPCSSILAWEILWSGEPGGL